MTAELDVSDFEVPTMHVITVSNLDLPSVMTNDAVITEAREGAKALMLDGFTYPLYKTLRNCDYEYYRGIHGREGIDRWVRVLEDLPMIQHQAEVEIIKELLEKKGWAVETSVADAAEWEDDDE